MKIEVGKTYIDGRGCRYFIEAKLTHPAKPGHPFYGSGLDTKGFNWYNQSGEPWYDGSDEFSEKSNLLPNTVKKEGWTVVQPGKTTEWPGTFCQTAIMGLNAAQRVFRTLYEEKGMPGVLVRVEWEEEESL